MNRIRRNAWSDFAKCSYEVFAEDNCIDDVSNGGFLQFSAGAIVSPLPGQLARNRGACDYDIRHNVTVQYVYELPVKVRNREVGILANAWQLSGTVFWHSGVVFLC